MTSTHLRAFVCHRLLWMLLLLFPLSLTSCLDDVEYSNSPADLVFFSTDTLRLDTVISGKPSSYMTMKVYNPNGKAIRFSDINLECGIENSPFKVNIDGEPLTELTRTAHEINSKDSMFINVMVNIPEEDLDDPYAVSDKLTFTTEGGAVQKVVLEAAGQTVINLNGMRVSENMTLDATRPYQIGDSIVVERGAVLTLAAGTKLFFAPDASLIVHGSLHVEGEVGKTVMMRGNRLGNMFDGQAYDRIPAQWGGVVLRETSTDNRINFADIHSGMFGILLCPPADATDETRLTLENSIVHNTMHNAVELHASKVRVGNSQITNAGGNCVTVRGGDVTFVHCTIARFYIFTGGNGVALDFTNFSDTDGSPLPLKNLTFTNSIITGYASDEVMGLRAENYPNTEFNYLFDHSLVNTPLPETPDEHWRGCFQDKEDSTEENVSKQHNFSPEFDLHTLFFSFQLNEKSKAVGNADPAVSAATYPTDLLGQPRGTAPDMGCYQHVPEVKE